MASVAALVLFETGARIADALVFKAILAHEAGSAVAAASVLTAFLAYAGRLAYAIPGDARILPPTAPTSAFTAVVTTLHSVAIWLTVATETVGNAK